MLPNSIAFGSAPRREPDSQPIGQLLRQAVGQAVSRASTQADMQTKTRSLGLFSGGLCSGEPEVQQNSQRSSDNAIDSQESCRRFDSQPTDRRLCRPTCNLCCTRPSFKSF